MRDGRARVDLDYCANADAADVLGAMPDGCIDLFLTDPPWGTSRLALDDDGRPPVDVWRQVKRTLKPDGWLMSFGTIPMFMDILSAGMVDGWTYIWMKSAPNLNLQPTRRPAGQHEVIHVSHKGGKASDRYYDQKALMTYGHTNYYRYKRPRIKSTWDERYGLTHSNSRGVTDGSRMATTILRFEGKNRMAHHERTDHPTQKPHDLLAHLVRGYCPPDGVVCDPYAGSGSVLMAARACGRHWIGVERDPKWHGLIRRRMTSVLDYDDDEKEGAGPEGPA